MRVVRWRWLATIAAASVVVWFATAGLAAGAQLLTVLLLVVFPAAFSLQAGIADEVPDGISRLGVYGGSAAGLLLLAGLVYGVARASGFGNASFGLVLPPVDAALLWAAGITAAGLAIQVAARALGEGESALLLYVLPRSDGDKAAFVGLSLCAGTCEELAYRGFLLTALTTTTGNALAAALIGAAAFGVLHAYQRRDGVLRAGLLGLLLTLPVVATGSIVPSMIAHTALDVIGGIFAQRLFRA